MGTGARLLLLQEAHPAQRDHPLGPVQRASVHPACRLRTQVGRGAPAVAAARGLHSSAHVVCWCQQHCSTPWCPPLRAGARLQRRAFGVSVAGILPTYVVSEATHRGLLRQTPEPGRWLGGSASGVFFPSRTRQPGVVCFRREPSLLPPWAARARTGPGVFVAFRRNPPHGVEPIQRSVTSSRRGVVGPQPHNNDEALPGRPGPTAPRLSGQAPGVRTYGAADDPRGLACDATAAKRPL